MAVVFITPDTQSNVCNCRQQRIEQERRDRELALRLAQEDQSQVEELPGRSAHIVSFWLWWKLPVDLFACLSHWYVCFDSLWSHIWTLP